MRGTGVALILLLFLLAACGGAGVGGPLPLLGEPDIAPPQDVPDLAEITAGAPRHNADGELMIRVLIGTSGFAGRVHESVTVTSDGDFVVLREGGNSTYVQAGNTFEIQSGEYDKFIIQPGHPDARLQIVGLRRNHPDGASPFYRGLLEISAVSGGFIVINELKLEEYLYAVVPSEMPGAWGIEAAKVQAITARSFAYRQFYENRFRAYGAHVDDSVMSQVYNNLPETEIARAAVRATRGMVLAYDGRVIVANYFAASGGTTANAGEVWPAAREFPGESPAFLRARAQFDAGFSVGDLRCEETAAAFFRSHDIPAFEAEVPWFRWQVRISASELSASINAGLSARRAADASLVRGATGIGNLQDIEVISRGQGGNVMEMRFAGSAGTVYVQTEFNLRTLLAPRNSVVTLANGNTLNGWGMLPSAFFTMEIERDALGGLAGVIFFGGGHGHGVGMSQHGARALLERGYTYHQVLAHFYPGAEIKLLY